MKLDSGAIVAVIALITLMLAAAGVAGGQFRISKSQAILGNYREAAQAWQAKSEAQQAEIDELKDQTAEKDQRIAALEQQVTELRGHMTAIQEMMIGSSALEAIRQDIHDARDRILTAVGKA